MIFFKTLGFQLFLLKHSLKSPIINVFHNKNQVGVLDNKGQSFYIDHPENSNVSFLKYSNSFSGLKTLNFKYYEENEKKTNWFIMDIYNRIYFKKTNKLFYYSNSTQIYNSFSNESSFQIYSNGKVFKEGEEIKIDKSLYDRNWINGLVHQDKYLILMNLDHELIIYDMELKYFCYKEQYITENPVFKIIISETNNFINLYIGYKNLGIRMLGFFGGFNNNIQKMFLPLSDIKDFSATPSGPFLVTHNERNITLYKKVRTFPFEKIYTGFFPSILRKIINIRMINETVYSHSFSEIYSFFFSDLVY